MSVTREENNQEDGRICEINPLVENLVMAGVNHKSAALCLRERVALPKGGTHDFVAGIMSRLPLRELVALSTCNRTEFYYTAEQPVPASRLFEELLKDDPKAFAELMRSVYTFEGEDVPRHLFRVTCGLDSLVLGETQILGQVKRAYERSREEGLTSTALNLLFQKAFEATKKIHTQTSLASHRASIPTVALKLSEAIFEDLDNASVLVVGTGEIARITLDALHDQGAKKIAFVTRTAERARVWSETYPDAEVRTMDDLPELLSRSDIVVSATATEKPVITVPLLVSALKKRKNRGRPVLLLDLGVPRNIESAAGILEQVFLHNIDDLSMVADKNRQKLELEVKRAESIIDDALDEYARHCRGAAAGSTIGELRSAARQIADMEMERTFRKLPDLTDREKEEIGELVHRLLGKLLHEPTQNLRLSLHDEEGQQALSWARRLFGLDSSSRRNKS